MTAKWGNKRLEERLQEIDRNAQAREEEARRPKTVDELVTLKVEDIETCERIARALVNGLNKQIGFADKRGQASTRDVGGGWLESTMTRRPDRRTWLLEADYELMPDAYRVRVQSKLEGGTLLREGHFLVPAEVIAEHTRNKHEYEAWLMGIAKALVAGQLRPPNARARDTEGELTLSQDDIFARLGLIDQTVPAVVEVDTEAAIASIRRAFEEDE